MTVTVQDQTDVVAADVQGLLLEADKPVGFTVNVGGGVQLHITVAVLLF